MPRPFAMLPIQTLCLTAALWAQDPAGQAAASRPAEDPIPRVLEWPAHRDLVLAELDGRPVRLGELVTHLEAHYDPGIRARLEADAGELNSPNLPQLLYQYVDVLALRAEVEQQKLEIHKLMERVDQFLARDFEQNGSRPGSRPWAGRCRLRACPTCPPATAASRACASRSRPSSTASCRASTMGGPQDLQHPPRRLLRWQGPGRASSSRPATRGPGGALPEGRLAEVRSRLREVLTRLKQEPQSFGELARKYSEDSTTAAEGGVIGWVSRLDERLPAAIVRTAWGLENGDISVPVESYHGLHVVQRVAFNRTHFILFNGKSAKQVADTRKRIEAEDYLFAARERHARRFRL
ncbi:MAG: peptidylprolyl isomerase [Planctomycetota bacterium]